MNQQEERYREWGIRFSIGLLVSVSLAVIGAATVVNPEIITESVVLVAVGLLTTGFCYAIGTAVRRFTNDHV